jgi:hypothetical protein
MGWRGKTTSGWTLEDLCCSSTNSQLLNEEVPVERGQIEREGYRTSPRSHWPNGGECVEHLGKVSCEVLWPKVPGSPMLHSSPTEYGRHVWHRVNKAADGRTAHQADRPLGINTGMVWEKLPHHPPSTVHHRQPTCRADASNLLRGVRSTVRWPCPNQPS